MRYYNAKDFHWDAERREFRADASDLRIPPGESPWDRIYQDAIDVGIVLIGLTGREVTYYMESEDEGCWVFKPTVESLRKVRGCKGTKVIIFND